VLEFNSGFRIVPHVSVYRLGKTAAMRPFLPRYNIYISRLYLNAELTICTTNIDQQRSRMFVDGFRQLMVFNVLLYLL